MSVYIIAVDGPAASGKGTLSRQIAAHYGWRHLDTGLTYRAVAKAMLDRGYPLSDEAKAVEIAQMLDLSTLDGAVLAAHDIGNAASKIATLPILRQALVAAQRKFAEHSEHNQGAVLDGRDIGTVVCPNAHVKFFVSASAEKRAERRTREINGNGGTAHFDAILQDLKARDARDSERKTSPLKPAQDAHLIDTTNMSIEQAFTQLCAHINARIERDTT